MTIFKDENLRTVVPIIETYRNGRSWYRIWADGWCEQGTYVNNTANQHTATLLKAYKDTDYFCSATYETTTDTDGFGNGIAIGIISKNQVWISKQTDECWWETKGFLAEGQY